MRTTATYKRYMTADLYEWTGTFDNRQYNTSREFHMSCHADATTTLRVFTDMPLQLQSRIRNIRDRFGVVLYPTDDPAGITYEVFNVKPIVTPMQTVEGYENQARRIS